MNDIVVMAKAESPPIDLSAVLREFVDVDDEEVVVEMLAWYPGVKYEQLDLARALICIRVTGGFEIGRSVGVVKLAGIEKTIQWRRELENMGVVPNVGVEEEAMEKLVNEVTGAYVRRPAALILFHGGGGVIPGILNLIAVGVHVILVALPEHVHDACHNRDGLTILDPKSLGWCYPPRSDDEWRERGEDHA